jgi:L,D-transpeptidase ErfK/SrfK
MYNLTLLLSLLLFLNTSFALTFQMPKSGNIVGELQTANVKKGESLADIGRLFDVGVYEMMEANPNVDPWAPDTNTAVVIPTQFILPPEPYTGVVINLAEMRVYLFHPQEPLVTTHPVGIGRKGWHTPIATGKVIQKKKYPSWRPPKSIRELYASKGRPLPKIVPPGPENPLGKYALRLSIPGYLIHGTNRAAGVGVRSSSGCIRLFPEDIQSFFHKVDLGTQVRIIHMPYKFGRYRNNLYLEAHQPLSDPYYNPDEDEVIFANALQKATMDTVSLDWFLAKEAIERSRGYPMLIK